MLMTNLTPDVTLSWILLDICVVNKLADITSYFNKIVLNPTLFGPKLIQTTRKCGQNVYFNEYN